MLQPSLTSASMVNQFRKAAEDALTLVRSNAAGATIDGDAVTKQLVDVALLL